MNILKDLYYTKEHEWVKVEGNIAVMGITDYAVEQLGDIVFIELPNVGDSVSQGDNLGVVESVKTVSDIFAPLSGEVLECNTNLLQEVDGEENEEFYPEYVNEDPYEKGWMIKLKVSSIDEVKNLLSSEQYKSITKE